MNRRLNIRGIHGLGLVEVMVSLVVLGILLSVAIPSFSDLLNRRRVMAVAAEISADLAYARAESGLRPQGVTVFFQRNDSVSCYTIAYYASGGGCDCTRGQEAACDGGTIEHKTMQIPSKIGVSFASFSSEWTPVDPGQVSFQSPQMTASVSDFSVTVSGRRSQLIVQLSKLGRIRTCSPNGSISGVPVC